MKYILSILLFFSLNLSATDYYVSPSGDDTNPGTIGSPFRNWQKLADVLNPGDIGYIRGGTYVPTTAMNLFRHCDWSNINGTSASPIIIQNYPGEVPVYDFTGYVITRDDAFCVFIDFCSYLTVKGLRITGFAQVSTGAGVSRGMAIDNSPFVTIEQCTIDHMGGSAFVVGNASDYLYFLNCDAYYNADALSTPAYGGSNGFEMTGGVTSTNITFDGCRAWWNSDDGFDFFSVDGVVTIRNSWSFWNGYIPGGFSTGGDGEGFKLGPTNTTPKVSTTRLLYNCLSFENRTTGFGQNTAETQMYIVNCTAYSNGVNGFWFGWYPGYAQPFYNNISYDNTTADLNETGGNVGGATNTWDGGVTVTDADFQSVSSTGMDGSRNSDGSLPGLAFLRLASTSDLINAGTYIFLPYCSTAPDMGAYEFNNCYKNNFKTKKRNAIH